MNTRLIAITLLLGTSVCSAASVAIKHDGFDKILRETVRPDGMVDYLAIRKSHWSELNSYLDQFADADPSTLPRDDALAAYINLYNATIIRTVVLRLKSGYAVSQNKWGVFKEKLVSVNGKRISLDDLEHKIIRPDFNDPRIHVALVCAAKSCPPLLNRAYRGSDLQSVLEQRMKDFINDSSRNRVDMDRGRLQVSQVFNWFAEDFGGKSKVATYIDKYRGESAATYAVTFLEYDWSLNDATPVSGEWVFVTSSRVRLYASPAGNRPLAYAVRNQILEIVDRQSNWVKVDRGFGKPLVWMYAAYGSRYK